MLGTSSSRFLPFFVFVFLLAGIGASSPSASAQNAIPDRITAAISNSSRAVIPGSVSPKLNSSTDLGPASPDTRLLGLSLRFTPSVAQQAALDQLLADQQNPSSPRFHQWLNPLQFAAQFGLSSNDIAKITAWLASQGFTVTGVANGGSFITFDGTVAQAQTAFATSIHNLSVNGESHFANVTNPSLPSAFAAVVGAVTGLHDFRARPHLHTSIVKPNFTSSLSGDHFLAPGDLYTIYDVNPLLVSFTGAGIGTGSKCNTTPSGLTCGDIAVMGAVDISTSDIANFRLASGLSSTNLPTTVHEPATGDPGAANNCIPQPGTNCAAPNLLDLDESSIDLEWSGAMAPGASILFVNGKDIFLNSMTEAIDLNLAPILTISYGECEAGWGTAYLNSFNSLFKQASAQGQTILVAAGDVGATDCESETETAATEGPAVDFPGSSPYVTSMGGTMYNEGNATGVTPYWNSNSSSTSSNSGSAVSYIPEAAWSDLGYGYFGGGGGGVSSFFAKPAWQVETGAAGMTTLVLPDSARDVPDLALDASDVHDPYLFCASGSCVTGYRQSNSDLSVAGGTSFDSQIFGGMLALIEQKVGSRLGNINPTLYALGNKTAYYNPTSTSVFHDVTVGSNAMPCATGSVECPFSGSIGYSATTGFDLATGWGSVDLNNLANDWTLVTPPVPPALGANLSATTLTASTSSVGAGSAVTLTASVSGSAVAPTGSVQFLVNNVAVGTPVTLNSSGVATYAWTPTCSSLGQQSLTAVYSGDTNYQGSIGPVLTANGTSTNSGGAIIDNPLIVTVTAGTTCPSFAVTGPSGANTTITVAAGGTIPAVTITVAPVNGLSGTIVFSATVVDTSGYVPGFTFTPASISIPSASSTSLTITGLTAGLRLPSAPGKMDPGTMLARQSSGPTPAASNTRFAAGTGIAIASLLLLVLPRRRRLGGLLLVALSVALALGAGGCGSSQTAPPTTTTTTTNPFAGTYIVTVIGAYTGTGNIPSQSTTLTYVIN
ncbi:MAG TPA: protease pro-enzyme activation domain-containing protein [Acidobacteriaceae bacterium]|nr:protease pro-enzyme activation domain-containing protein [Acidobacteriaceae bacterium]